MANSKQIHENSLASYHGQYFKDQMIPGSSEEVLMSTVSHDRLKKKMKNTKDRLIKGECLSGSPLPPSSNTIF